MKIAQKLSNFKTIIMRHSCTVNVIVERVVFKTKDIQITFLNEY